MNTPSSDVQFSIKPESAALSPRVELLLDRVFGAERRLKASYLYREEVAPIAPLSYVALDQNKKLVGSIRYWPIQVGETGHPALLLGPLAISPHLAGRGIGRALTFRTLEIAAELGYDLVLLVGDYDYYKRFGFVPGTPYGFVMPTEQRPERLQVTELRQGVLGRISGEIRHVKEDNGSVITMPMTPRRRVRRTAARA